MQANCIRILKALYPDAIRHPNGRPMMQWEFEDQYCRVTLKRFGMGRPVRVVEGGKNLPLLRQKLNGFMLRVKKEDVLKDLPPVRYDVVPIGVDVPLRHGYPPFLQTLATMICYATCPVPVTSI